MKYGKSDIQRKLSPLTTEKLEQKAGMTLVRLFLISFLALTVGVVCAGYGIVIGLVENAPDISSLSTVPTETATYIYSENGEKQQKLTAPTSNRIPVSLEQIPIDMQHAIVAIEDERFYQHNGIDVRGIIRAFVAGVTRGNFSQGASTITQQLLKNSVFTSWATESTLAESIKRKIQEQYLAIKLEENLEETMNKEDAKNHILTDYLNTINFGAGTYGIQAASLRYFNKDASELTLSECAVIAGITQNPTAYNPIEHPKANAQRRKTVLNNMLYQGYITTEQFNEALEDAVYDRIQENAFVTDESSDVYTYYTDALVSQVLEDLVTIAGYSSTQASNAVYTGGLKIYSVQDSEIQRICDEEFANPDNFPAGTLIGLDYALSIFTANGETIHYDTYDLQEYFSSENPDFSTMFTDEETARFYASAFREAHTDESTTILGERISFVLQPQASVVMIDQSTGYVKAIVGGRGKKEASLTLNRATKARRQPGSTFKPLAVYAPILEKGKTLASLYENAPYQYQSGAELKNWDSDDYGYSGLETIHTALMKSINVVAVEAITQLTPLVSLDYLEKLGISTLYNGEVDADGNVLSDAFQPLALGGVTDGVVNLELTAAYAALANQGSYIQPKFYSRVEDQNGNVILDNTSEEHQVFSSQTAYLMTKAMESVISDPEGTAYGYISLGEMPASGKTGTTDNAKDIWFEGYTPYYTCGIWGGYDNNAALPAEDKSYSLYAKILWNSIMNRIHESLAVKDFPQPDNITTAVICKKSGKLAVSGVCDCDPRGSQIMTEFFVSGTEPSVSCDMHVSVKICEQTGLVATSTCTQTRNDIYMRLLSGASTETSDAQYQVPTVKCEGHKLNNALDAGNVPIISDNSQSPNPASDIGEALYPNSNAQNNTTDSNRPTGGIMVDGRYYEDNTGLDFDDIEADNFYDNGVNVY